MHTFSRSGHFPLRDKDGGHTIGSAISDIRKLHATRKPDGAIFSRTGVMGDRSLRCRDSNFRPSLLMWPWPLPMTFIYELDPYSWEIHRMCTFLTSRLSKAIVWQTYRETDRQVTHGHFRSRDKDGGHTIGSAIPKKHDARIPESSIFTEPELWAIEVYIAGIGILDVFGFCDLDLDPMTFIYELDPYCVKIYRLCKYELHTSRLSKVIVWQTDIQTDGQSPPADMFLWAQNIAKCFFSRDSTPIPLWQLTAFARLSIWI